jgi:hypothetical protein
MRNKQRGDVQNFDRKVNSLFERILFHRPADDIQISLATAMFLVTLAKLNPISFLPNEHTFYVHHSINHTTTDRNPTNNALLPLQTPLFQKQPHAAAATTTPTSSRATKPLTHHPQTRNPRLDRPPHLLHLPETPHLLRLRTTHPQSDKANPYHRSTRKPRRTYNDLGCSGFSSESGVGV